MSIFICKEDLYKNQYPRQILKDNIYAVSLLDILKTQKLTAEFCVKYILNSDFQFLPEDQQIDMELVAKLQPHISRLEFVTAQVEASKKKQLRQRIHSFDFEEYAERNS
jgi:hypothetical protein